MIEYTNKTNELTLNEIRKKVKAEKVIVVLTDDTDIQNLRGYIYAISKDKSSFNELCDESSRLRNSNTQNIIVGNYKRGGLIGVQYDS